MALAEYKRKRKFTDTPEPPGSKPVKSATVLRFVVQKHEATRLHYDVRLELGGVMKSWAVPKGPSMNPAEKHLAMMVEDHPLEYHNFEGIIPEGNYGAGTVMVWDTGTYTVSGAKDAKDAQKLVTAGLAKGDLKFVLNGKKLKGEFVMFRFARAGDNAWIMMKHKDEFVGGRIVDAELSAVTGRTMKQIAADAEPQTNVLPVVNKKLFPKATKSKMPTKLNPMLATLVSDAFDDPDWVFEVKWDGYRIMSKVVKGEVTLISRNGMDFTSRYGEIAADLVQIGADVVVDGEVVVVDKHGRSDFQALQHHPRPHSGHLVYYVFDLLHYNGYDLSDVPLVERKRLLKSIVPTGTRVIYSDHIQTQGKQFLKLAKEREIEGIVAKKSDSVYKMGTRSQDWRKIKLRAEQELIICGYTESESSRHGIGSLLVGYYAKSKLKFAGHVGTGFGASETEALLQVFGGISAAKSPFADSPRLTGIVHWLNPDLVCQVKFAEWTDEGLLRQASYQGLRDDKSPKSVTKES